MPAKKTAKTKPAARNAAKPNTIVTKSKPITTKLAKTTPASKSDVKSKPVTKKAAKLERTNVFVSYSHADKKWLSRLQVHLKPLERDHKINIWADTLLRGGDKWRDEIDKALAKAKVAILLVSADFMASDFISKNELPPLLKAAEKEGLIILTVILGRTGAFTNHPISVYQAINGPSEPLNLFSEGQVDEVFSQLYSRILNIFISPITKTTPRLAAKADISVDTKKGVTAKKTEIPIKFTTTKTSPLITKKVNAQTHKDSSNALLVKRNGEWMVVPVSHGNVGSEIRLDLRLTTSTQRAFVSSLRQSDNLGSIVYRSQTHICKGQDVQMTTTGTKEVWHLKATLQSINRRADVTYGIMKPEKQAEINARLLLLNETASNEQSPFGNFSYHTQVNGGTSPLPALYKQLNKQATAFKQTAPLIIVWFLQTNSIIDHIHKMTFSLKADILKIQFEGERISQYQNEAPAVIKVEGILDLSKSVTEKPLRLSN